MAEKKTSASSDEQMAAQKETVPHDTSGLLEPYLLEDALPKKMRSNVMLIEYFKRFVLVDSPEIEEHHAYALSRLIILIRKALVVDLYVREDIHHILLNPNNLTKIEMREWVDNSSRLNYFWNWKKHGVPDILEDINEENDNIDEEESKTEATKDAQQVAHPLNQSVSCQNASVVETITIRDNEGTALSLSDYAPPAALALMVPLGLAGCPRTAGVEKSSRDAHTRELEFGTPSLVCMPSVNHRAPNLLRVGDIMDSCFGGEVLLDDNYRSFFTARDKNNSSDALAVVAHNGNDILKTLNGLPLLAQDFAEGESHHKFAGSTVSEANMVKQVDAFFSLIFGDEIQKENSSDGATTSTPTIKEKTMATYVSTLVNLFVPFGNDVTKFGTWKNLYTHLCGACGLTPSKLAGPFCFARLFQRCRLLIQSTSPPVPALVDGLTRATAMVYYLSGVFKLSDSEASEKVEFSRRVFTTHKNPSLATPFWTPMTKLNDKGFLKAMKHMSKKIPFTLLSFGEKEFGMDTYTQEHAVENLRIIKAIGKQFQDQVNAATHRSIKEEMINVLEAIDFTPPAPPTYIEDPNKRKEYVCHSLVSMDLHAPHGYDSAYFLPQSQIFPRLAIVTKALLSGGDENPLKKVNGKSRRLVELVGLLDEEGANYSDIGKSILHHLQRCSKGAFGGHYGQYLPHHFFDSGNIEGMTAVAAAVVTIATFVHSTQSRNKLVALLKSDGRGSVIQVNTPNDPDQAGMLIVTLPDRRTTKTSENVTTSKTATLGVFDTPGNNTNDGSLIFQTFIWCVCLVTADWSGALLYKKTRNYVAGRVRNRVQFAVGSDMIELLSKYGSCITVTDELAIRLPYLYALLANEGQPFCRPTLCDDFVGNFPLFVSFVRNLVDKSILEFDEERIKSIVKSVDAKASFKKPHYNGRNRLSETTYEDEWTPRFRIEEKFAATVDSRYEEGNDEEKRNWKMVKERSFTWEDLLLIFVYGMYNKLCDGEGVPRWTRFPYEFFRSVRTLFGDSCKEMPNSIQRLKREMHEKSFVLGPLQKIFDDGETPPPVITKYIEQYDAIICHTKEDADNLGDLPPLGPAMSLVRYGIFHAEQKTDDGGTKVKTEIKTNSCHIFECTKTRFQKCCGNTIEFPGLFWKKTLDEDRHDRNELPDYIIAIQNEAREKLGEPEQVDEGASRTNRAKARDGEAPEHVPNSDESSTGSEKKKKATNKGKRKAKKTTKENKTLVENDEEEEEEEEPLDTQLVVPAVAQGPSVARKGTRKAKGMSVFRDEEYAEIQDDPLLRETWENGFRAGLDRLAEKAPDYSVFMNTYLGFQEYAEHRAATAKHAGKEGNDDARWAKITPEEDDERERWDQLRKNASSKYLQKSCSYLYESLDEEDGFTCKRQNRLDPLLRKDSIRKKEKQVSLNKKREASSLIARGGKAAADQSKKRSKKNKEDKSGSRGKDVEKKRKSTASRPAPIKKAPPSDSSRNKKPKKGKPAQQNMPARKQRGLDALKGLQANKSSSRHSPRLKKTPDDQDAESDDDDDDNNEESDDDDNDNGDDISTHE